MLLARERADRRSVMARMAVPVLLGGQVLHSIAAFTADWPCVALGYSKVKYTVIQACTVGHVREHHFRFH